MESRPTYASCPCAGVSTTPSWNLAATSGAIPRPASHSVACGVSDSAYTFTADANRVLDEVDGIGVTDPFLCHDDLVGVAACPAGEAVEDVFVEVGGGGLEVVVVEAAPQVDLAVVAGQLRAVVLEHLRDHRFLAIHSSRVVTTYAWEIGFPGALTTAKKPGRSRRRRCF